MVTRLGLLRDCCKARFFDPKISQQKNGDCIILTDALLKEWDEKATEVVECEAINDSMELSDGTIIGSEERPLTILRVVHADGTVNIEPFWKLFPINPSNHITFLRNTFLSYVDVKAENEKLAHFVIGCRRINPYFRGDVLCGEQLRWAFCRKYDITEIQARSRMAAANWEDWEKVFPGLVIDEDLCWKWCM